MLKGDCYYLSILSVIANSALLVQLVERRFPKPDVEGSSPSGRDYIEGQKRLVLLFPIFNLNVIFGIKKGIMERWLSGRKLQIANLMYVLLRTVGSNPILSF